MVDTVSRKPERVCVGEIVGVHGVRGLVKIRPFTAQPDGVVSYGDPTDDTGRRQFRIALRSMVKGAWIAEVEGVADRDTAEGLRGIKLFVPRGALPPPEEEDEFYYHDLIGLTAFQGDGRVFGRVRNVVNHGAGDIVEIECPDGSSVDLPFTRAVVPVVDIGAGRVVVDPPVTAGDESPSGAGEAADG